MSIQEAYRLYRQGGFFVNRKYQRKLVWTEEEKARLIDSVLQNYPIPLILLAEKLDEDGTEKYEIIDGIQRLNAIFAYIENKFPTENGAYFDINESTRARQLADEGVISCVTDEKKKLSS
jgi:uncharacterized protein with ParB-like and HNH nuclease domain